MASPDGVIYYPCPRLEEKALAKGTPVFSLSLEVSPLLPVPLTDTTQQGMSRVHRQWGYFLMWGAGSLHKTGFQVEQNRGEEVLSVTNTAHCSPQRSPNFPWQVMETTEDF